MEFYEFFKDTLVHKSGLPKWVISILLEVFTLPLIAFAGFSELLEAALHLEAPANQLIPLCLTLALYWLVLIHYLSRKPGWIAAALATLLALTCVATFKLWILYHSSPTAEAISLTIPFLVVAVAFLVMTVVTHDLATSTAMRTPATRTKWVAAGVGVGLFGAAFVAAIARPEDWYFLLDTIFAEGIPEGRVGLVLAPYNRDPDDDARSRMQGDLAELLDADPTLAKQIKLVRLRRPVPAFDGDRDKQQEMAKRIAFYDGARVLVYGTVEGKYQGYLVRTRLALIRPTQFLRDALTIPQLIEQPVTNDAASVRYLAAVVASASSYFAGKCTTAEKLADSAAAALRSIPQQTRDSVGPAGTAMFGLLKANSIACQVADKTAPPQKLPDAFALLDAILGDPATPIDQRLAAASTKGSIQRRTATEATGSTIDKREGLRSAIETYTAALDHLPQDADPFFVAGVWNGLGVAREKLQETIEQNDKAAQLGMVASALEAYNAAVKLLGQATGTNTRASPADVAYLRAVVICNRANAVFKQGLVKDDPELIAEAVKLEQSQLPILDSEYWIHSDLAGGFMRLASYRDPAVNFRQAREQAERGLATVPEEVGEDIVMNFVIGLARANLALARGGFEPSAETQAIADMTCAVRLFRHAGRDVGELEKALNLERLRIGAAAFAAAQNGTPPAVEGCR